MILLSSKFGFFENPVSLNSYEQFCLVHGYIEISQNYEFSS